jgi:hypothetical protein
MGTVYFEDEDGNEYPCDYECIPGEKRTRTCPGHPPFISVYYEDVEEKIGRDLEKFEIENLRDQANELEIEIQEAGRPDYCPEEDLIRKERI